MKVKTLTTLTTLTIVVTAMAYLGTKKIILNKINKVNAKGKGSNKPKDIESIINSEDFRASERLLRSVEKRG